MRQRVSNGFEIIQQLNVRAVAVRGERITLQHPGVIGDSDGAVRYRPCGGDADAFEAGRSDVL